MNWPTDEMHRNFQHGWLAHSATLLPIFINSTWKRLPRPNKSQPTYWQLNPLVKCVFRMGDWRIRQHCCQFSSIESNWNNQDSQEISNQPTNPKEKKKWDVFKLNNNENGWTEINTLKFAAFWRCARRNRATRRALAAARRTTSSTNWPRCCPFRRPSRHSWIKHPSSGWPFPSSGSKTSPATESRPGSKKIPSNPSKVFFWYSILFVCFLSFFLSFFLSYFFLDPWLEQQWIEMWAASWRWSVGALVSGTRLFWHVICMANPLSWLDWSISCVGPSPFILSLSLSLSSPGWFFQPGER